MRVCKEPGCGLEALPRRQRCEEDHLARQPPIVRIQAAERRLSLIPEAARKARVPEKQWPAGRRWCAGCQTFVRLQDASGSRCKACASIAGHTARIKSEFGIDAMTYQWLLERQGGKCAICRQFPKTVRLSVDHDHTLPCGSGSTREHEPKRGCIKCIRGLVCSRCNGELLPAALHSVHILRNAVAYMENPPFRGEWQIPEFERKEYQEKYHTTDDPAPF